MANAIGFEEISVKGVPVGPTSTLVQGGVACAVFYVDDDAPGRVRWRPATTSVRNTATSTGFPLKPGAWISVAGEANIRNSLFTRDGGLDGAVTVYVLYFDRVDVIAADFTGVTAKVLVDRARAQEALLDEILLELRRHTDHLQEAVNLIAAPSH